MIKITDSKTAEQAPTVDHLYANAGKKPTSPQIENEVPEYKQGGNEDMLNAYILGQNNLLFAQGIRNENNAVPGAGPIVEDATDPTVAPDLPQVQNVMS